MAKMSNMGAQKGLLGGKAPNIAFLLTNSNIEPTCAGQQKVEYAKSVEHRSAQVLTVAGKGLTVAIATIAEASRYTPNGRSKPSCCSSLRSASRRAHTGSSSFSVFASVAWRANSALGLRHTAPGKKTEKDLGQQPARFPLAPPAHPAACNFGAQTQPLQEAVLRGLRCPC